MGRKYVTLTIQASLSDHNSEEDAEDLRQWSEFVERVKGVARECQMNYLDIDFTESN